VSAKTAERYQQLIKFEIVSRIGQLPIQKVKPAHLQELYGTLLKEGSVDGEPLARAQSGMYTEFCVERLVTQSPGAR
jgi:Phage integrase, N-terminal SAM-like domain